MKIVLVAFVFGLLAFESALGCPGRPLQPNDFSPWARSKAKDMIVFETKDINKFVNMVAKCRNKLGKRSLRKILTL